MKAKYTSTAAFIFAATFMAGTQVVPGQPSSPTINIAIVDIDFLLENVQPSKDAKARTQEMHEAYGKEYAAMQAELGKLKTTLAAKRQSLSQDVYVKMLEEIQEKTIAYQRRIQEQEGRLASILRDARAIASDTVLHTVADIKKERNVALILLRNAVVGPQSVPDLTSDILERINSKR